MKISKPIELYAEERRKIGRLLQRIREQRRLTQHEVAKDLDLSQARLSRIEAGAASLSAEEFLRVLRLFNVSIDATAQAVEQASSEISKKWRVLTRLQPKDFAEALIATRADR